MSMCMCGGYETFDVSKSFDPHTIPAARVLMEEAAVPVTPSVRAVERGSHPGNAFFAACKVVAQSWALSTAVFGSISSSAKTFEEKLPVQGAFPQHLTPPRPFTCTRRGK